MAVLGPRAESGVGGGSDIVRPSEVNQTPIGIPVIPYQNTSGTGTSPGSPAATTSAGPSKGIIDYSKTRATGILSPALTSHYRCKFYPSNISANGALLKFLKDGDSAFPGSDYSNIFNQDLIELSCSEASLPGSSLMTNEIADDHTGVTERPAYRRQYDDRIDFTFYVDNNYKIINFFERWISYCAGENDQDKLDDKNYFYRVPFPDDYQVSELYITKFERTAQPRIGKNIDTNAAYTGSVLEYKFIRAYPLSIASMPVSYDSSQLLKCTVSFSFVRYVRKMVKIDKSKEPRPSTPPGVPQSQFGVDTTGQFGQTGFNITRTPLNINPATGGNLLGQ